MFLWRTLTNVLLVVPPTHLPCWFLPSPRFDYPMLSFFSIKSFQSYIAFCCLHPKHPTPDHAYERSPFYEHVQ